jgi:hypothetical protein
MAAHHTHSSADDRSETCWPPGTPDDDRKLMAMIEAGMNKQVIARKLKRTVMAVTSRLGKIRKRERQTKMASMSVKAGKRGL